MRCCLKSFNQESVLNRRHCPSGAVKKRFVSAVFPAIVLRGGGPVKRGPLVFRLLDRRVLLVFRAFFSLPAHRAADNRVGDGYFLSARTFAGASLCRKRFAEAPDRAESCENAKKNRSKSYDFKRFSWSCYPDSNWRPHPYQGCALPAEL